MTPSVSHLRVVDSTTDDVGIDVAKLALTPPMGSSWQYRRLVIGGHVWLDPVALAKPAMQAREIHLLTSLTSQSRQVLEFGAGGSTALMLKMGVQRLVSVESDADWVGRLLLDDAVGRAAKDGRLDLMHVDIGPTGFMGGPRAGSLKERWPGYAQAPWAHVDAERLDLVFIDGRFRVACILETVLRVTPRTIIAIHDFWNRPAYHSVLPYLEEIRRCQTLGVFRVRSDFDPAQVKALLDDAYYVPF